MGFSVYFKLGLGKRCRLEKEEGKVEGDGSDDICGVCGDGGMFICCDYCLFMFYLICMDFLVGIVFFFLCFIFFIIFFC